MKRLLIFAAAWAFALAASQSRADVSVNFFYDNLNGGSWYQVPDYGYVWQPDAATSADWRPYTDGYWAYTDVGWTWVSYEDFGWATYHYGRWVRLEDYGWCWVPGYEWGPAWVSWRTGGNYVGWAPLPPEGGGEIVYESRPITARADVDFGIGPGYYNFIDVRFIGEPVLRGHFYPYDQNVVYINNTVNVTNITYNNSVVYNYGPDYAVVSKYSTRPIPRLKLERANLDPLQAVKAGSVTKVQGDKLVLAAPLKLQKPNTQIAPKAVKAKIDQPKIEKGWANISDPNTKAKLEQKLKTENPKNVPTPSSQPNATANVNALASPGVSPFEKGRGKQKGQPFQNQASASIAPGASPAASMTPFEQGHGKKGKAQTVENEPRASITLAPHQPSLSSRVRVSTKVRDSRLGPARQWLQVRRQMNASNRGRVNTKARNSRTHRAHRLLQVLPNPLNKAKARKKGALNMANKRLFLAEPSIPKIRMRIWTTKTIPRAENIKGTATTKTFSLDRRMSAAGLVVVASVASKFNLRLRRHRVDNMASRADNRVARVRVRVRKAKRPQLRLRGN